MDEYGKSSLEKTAGSLDGMLDSSVSRDEDCGRDASFPVVISGERLHTRLGGGRGISASMLDNNVLLLSRQMESKR